MSSSISDREAAMENKYAHDEQLDFNTEARCSKLFGLWVAEQLGLDGSDAATYAASVVEANLEEAGFDDILRKVRADLDEKSIEISDHALNVELDKALTEARRQLTEEAN
ncbi:MAG: hypothetical protein CMH26_05405 [Micavibrio sp.]|nr:hypothetical protein [Micavibrio sp.]|tara:strand:- start:39 stop:368 length:330 start_codon:yes stop_codon:yes gene_type:complete